MLSVARNILFPQMMTYYPKAIGKIDATRLKAQRLFQTHSLDLILATQFPSD